jgi:2-desacetyl-2-hydroxyethyl bacteriochlorophyllide A dehydrogenase
MTIARRCIFRTPYDAAIETGPLPALAADHLLIESTVSAVSAGTELLFYRGQVPPGMAVDTSIAGMDTQVAYPLAYGYAAVGVVVAQGPAVSGNWLGHRVFAFSPHASHFTARTESLLPIPAEVSDEQAALLPTLETAVGLIMDAQPLIGEHVLVFGQGVVGLCVTRLLHQFPLASLTVVDAISLRRDLALRWGAGHALPPEAVPDAGLHPDLIIEVSSNPAALAAAVRCAPFGARIIVGSWYGTKAATLDLGGSYHRNRIQILSSQVSTLDGRFSNRWDKARRIQVAWSQLAHLPVDDLVTHRFPIEAAADAYHLLDRSAAAALQVLFTYQSPSPDPNRPANS